MNAISELNAVLNEGWQERDLLGALRAWWQVIRGQVTPDDRVVISSQVTPDDPLPKLPSVAERWRVMRASVALRVLSGAASELRALEAGHDEAETLPVALFTEQCDGRALGYKNQVVTTPGDLFLGSLDWSIEAMAALWRARGVHIAELEDR